MTSTLEMLLVLSASCTIFWLELCENQLTWQDFAARLGSKLNRTVFICVESNWFCINYDWLKNFASLFHPIRSKVTKTNRDLLTRFPALWVVYMLFLRALIGSPYRQLFPKNRYIVRGPLL